MKLLRSKVVAMVLTLAMVISVFSIPVVNAAETAAITGTQAADFLKTQSLLQGDENGNLNLGQALKRQDAVVALSRLLGQEEEAKAYPTEEMTFTDVTNAYYAPYIAWSQANEYVQGYSDTTFGFGDAFTAWQCQALFVRALGYNPSNSEVLTKAAELGVSSGLAVADVNAPILRENMALLMFNTLGATTVDNTVLADDLGVVMPEPGTVEPPVVEPPVVEPPVVEKVAPVLSDVAASATSTTAATVTISGKVTPVTATVAVNGSAATVTEGAFSAVVNLVDGANNIEVVATNDTLTDSKTVAVTKVAVVPISVKAKNANGEAVDLAGATGMVSDRDSLFTMTFPEAVNKDSVTRTYLKLYEGTSPIALAAPTVKADGKTVTIGPSDNLKDNTQYKFVILKGIKKADGTTDVSAADQEFTFTTGSANYLTGVADNHPHVLSETVTTNVDADDAQYGDAINFTFKRDLDPSSISAASAKLYDITGGTNTVVPVVNKLGAANNKLETDISATDGLTTGHQYKLVLGSLKDLLGVNVALIEINFTVGATNVGADIYDADRSTVLTGNSKIWPRLASGSLDGTTAIKYGAKVYVKFDQTQAMDTATINSNTLYLEKLDKNGVVVNKVDATVEYDTTFRMASITPAADLDSDTQYKLTIKKGESGIKDILGLKVDDSDTDETLTVRTLDTTAPTVASVALKTGSANEATVASGLIDVDSTKQLRFAINFNEEIASVDNDGSYTAAKYDADLTDNIETAQKYFEAGKSIVVVNTTDDVVAVNSANLTASLSSDNKTLYITAPADTLEKAHSYAIKLAGKSSNPGSSLTTAHAIADRTNYNGTNAMGVNRLAEMYQFTFSTADADSVAPTVKEVRMGTDYDHSVVVPSGIKNVVGAATNIYILFSEKMKSVDSHTTFDYNGTASLGGKNVQIQKKPVGGNWAAYAPAVDSDGGASDGYILFTTDNTKDLSYLVIPAGALAANGNYKIVLTPGITPNGLEDLATPAGPTDFGNDVANDFNFEVTTTGGIRFSPIAAGAIPTTSVNTLAVGIAAGAGSAANTISANALTIPTSTLGAQINANAGSAANAVTTALTAEVGDTVGIFVDGGAIQYAVVDAVNGTNQVTSLATDITVQASNGNKIFNYTRDAWVGIETVDGAMVFAQVDAVNVANDKPTSLATNITAEAAVGAMIVNFGAAGSSFGDMQTAYGAKDPIAIRIDAVTADKVDQTTISDATVKLTKASDSSVVPVSINVVSGGNGDAFVSINPTADLEYNTQYKLKVEGVKDQLGNTIPVKETSFTTAKDSAAKITIPSVNPVDLSTGIAVNTPITVTFNDDISAACGASGGITDRAAANLVKGQKTAAGTNALVTAGDGAPGAAAVTVGLYDVTNTTYLTGRLELSADGKTLTIIPDALLKADTLYNILLGGGLSTNDNTAGADTSLATMIAAHPEMARSFSFRTETTASVKPQITSAKYINAVVENPAAVSYGDYVILTFNTGISTTGFSTITNGGNTYVYNLANQLVLDKAGVFQDSSTVGTVGAMAADVGADANELVPSAGFYAVSGDVVAIKAADTSWVIKTVDADTAGVATSLSADVGTVVNAGAVIVNLTKAAKMQLSNDATELTIILGRNPILTAGSTRVNAVLNAVNSVNGVAVDNAQVQIQ